MRGDVTPKQITRIQAARAAVVEAQRQLELAVVQALVEGASFRGISDGTGVATTTSQRYARAHGWPPPEIVEARQRAKPLVALSRRG